MDTECNDFIDQEPRLHREHAKKILNKSSSLRTAHNHLPVTTLNKTASSTQLNLAEELLNAYEVVLLQLVPRLLTNTPIQPLVRCLKRIDELRGPPHLPNQSFPFLRP